MPIFGPSLGAALGGGEKGDPGLSTYEIWLRLPGNLGKTEQQFIDETAGIASAQAAAAAAEAESAKVAAILAQQNAASEANRAVGAVAELQTAFTQFDTDKAAITQRVDAVDGRVGPLELRIATVEGTDFGGYVTQAALTSAIANVPPPPDLTPYALAANVPPPVDLAPYALAANVPPPVDITPLATKTELQAVQAAIPPTPDLTPYATTTALNSVAATIPPPPDLTGYVVLTKHEAALARIAALEAGGGPIAPPVTINVLTPLGLAPIDEGQPVSSALVGTAEASDGSAVYPVAIYYLDGFEVAASVIGTAGQLLTADAYWTTGAVSLPVRNLGPVGIRDLLESAFLDWTIAPPGLGLFTGATDGDSVDSILALLNPGDPVPSDGSDVTVTVTRALYTSGGEVLGTVIAGDVLTEAVFTATAPGFDPVSVSVTLGVTVSNVVSEPTDPTEPIVTPDTTAAIWWHDPSDLSSLYEDAAGTTPASVDGLVRRINDKIGPHDLVKGSGTAPTLRQADGTYYLEFPAVDGAVFDFSSAGNAMNARSGGAVFAAVTNPSHNGEELVYGLWRDLVNSSRLDLRFANGVPRAGGRRTNAELFTSALWNSVVTAPTVIAAVANWAGGQVWLRVDGAETAKASFPSGSGITDGGSVGANAFNNTSRTSIFSGRFFGGVGFNTLPTVEETQIVEVWLNSAIDGAPPPPPPAQSNETFQAGGQTKSDLGTSQQVTGVNA